MSDALWGELVSLNAPHAASIALKESEGEQGVTIGRDEKRCAVSFPEDQLISGAHCRVFLAPSGARVEDLGSSNGTFVNGVRIPKVSF
jgi:pSer/pThr/pTyr-binding forkhead associated (FHA) protein